jgi:hypothetical protein
MRKSLRFNRQETGPDKCKQFKPTIETLEDRMAPALFQAPIVTGTGALNPVSVAIGPDFNNDGNFDIAVVHNRSNNNSILSVLLGNGNGTFAQGPIFAIGNSATSVAVGDFDGSGHASIAVADPVDNFIAIFLGHGDGTFTQGVSDFFPVGAGPAVLATSDFNKDHITDLAVGTNNGRVWELKGSPTGFTNILLPSLGTAAPITAIATGDFNNDTNQDIVVASQARAVTVNVILGDGLNDNVFTLAPGSPISLTAIHATSFAVGDFRGVGVPEDLALANGPDNTVTLLLANGNGSYQAPTTLTFAGQPTTVVARDFNLDKNVDLVTTDAATNQITVRVGNGNGTFKAAQNFAAGSVPTGLAIGDFNGDAKPDVVVADFGNTVTGVGSAVSVLLNGSAGLDYMFSGPAAAVAGTQFSFTVTVKNFQGGTATGYRGTIHFTSSDNFAVLPSDYPFTAADAGVHTFMATLQSSGSQTIVGTDTNDSTINGTLTIPVTNPVPMITSLSTDNATEGSGQVPITVTGSGFSATSVVQWTVNGTTTSLSTSFLDNSHLGAVIPASNLVDEGTAGISVFNPTPGGGTAGPVTFTITDAALAAAGTPVTATEGSILSAQVATFTDANPKAPLTDFTTGSGGVTIDWGDGSQSAGTVSQPGGIGTQFIVTGTHTYAEEGSKSITVTITDKGSATTMASTTATIGDAPLSITTSPIKFTTGLQFSGQVATFLDVNKAAPLGDFSASIMWGDGVTSTGTITQPGGIGTTFNVSGSHTFTTSDTRIFKVTITDIGGSTVTGQALAGDFQSHDIAARVGSTGQWWVGQSNGSDSFTTSLWATWNPNANWVDVQTGDFNHDGKADIAARDLGSGTWWVAISNGVGFTTSLWGAWNPSVTWVDVHVGDFNHDGNADIIGRVSQTGQWWLARSTGSSFTNNLWAAWSPAATWTDIKVGDFNNDGLADIAGRVLQSGQWWVSLSGGSTAMGTALWTTWSPAATWVDVQVGDFNGDGSSDLAGRVSQSGQWWVSLSNGSTAFNTVLWGAWSPAVTWVDVKVGDFNGDGFTDIVGRIQQSGQWWVAFSNGSNGFSNKLFATWNPNANWVDVQVGDFNADGRDDIAGRVGSSGQWWTALSQGSTGVTSLWATWNPAANWVDVQNGVYVPG